jgi:hypothetical protein
VSSSDAVIIERHERDGGAAVDGGLGVPMVAG